MAFNAIKDFIGSAIFAFFISFAFVGLQIIIAELFSNKYLYIAICYFMALVISLFIANRIHITPAWVAGWIFVFLITLISTEPLDQTMRLTTEAFEDLEEEEENH